MLQFRAVRVEDIKSAQCPVDCWVIPRENDDGSTLRCAFYRLLVQGLRRCQGMVGLNPSVGGMNPDHREFFSGRLYWKCDEDEENEYAKVWDTPPFWSSGT